MVSPRSSATVWIIALVFAGVLIAACVAVTVCAVFAPGCASCHMKGPFASATSASSHAGVTCVECHVGRGVYPRVQMGFSEVFHMVIPLVPSAGRIDSLVPDSRCKTCHADVMAGTTRSNGLRIKHSLCAAGSACTDCHSMVAHGEQVAWPRTYSMDKCLHCHGNTDQLVSCTKCHGERSIQQRVTKGQWKVTHGPNWRKTHGMGDQFTCSACHPSGYCDRCHGIGLPHNKDWFSVHGQYGGQKGARCESCHPGPFCTGCHGTQMPHPKSFTPEHPSVVRRQGDALCHTCHLQSDCDRCHTLHVHPGGATGVPWFRPVHFPFRTN